MADRLTVSVLVPLTERGIATLRERIAPLAGQVQLRYEPGLMPVQRFPADHKGSPDFVRDAGQQAAWEKLLAATNVALGFPGDSPAGFAYLVEMAPELAWVHGTASGAGEQVRRSGIDAARLAEIPVTKSAGVHAVPLAEFALFGMLAFAKDIDVLRALARERRWPDRWPMRQLAGSRLTVVGLGQVGCAIAERAGALGMSVTGVRRHPVSAGPLPVQHLVGPDDLSRALSGADYVALALPGTAETTALIGAGQLAQLPRHAVLVNVGRGTALDEDALIEALRTGRLRGAVLDVTQAEPLHPGSPLWDMDNVIISPHTAALSPDEDTLISQLFAGNLNRFLSGQPLRNRIHPDAMY
jgi:glyoxylate/hydroxypyruvate reductase A